MDIYIPANNEREARHALVAWGFNRDLPLVCDKLIWGWFRVFVFRHEA